jgi:hypothetical protein
MVRNNFAIRNKLATWILTRNRRRIIIAGRLDFGESALRHRYLMYFMRKIDVLLTSVIDRIERTAMAAALTERSGSNALAQTNSWYRETVDFG